MSNKIEHPDYYNNGKIQVIDFISDQLLDFSLGNVVKYVCRAGLKVQDNESALEKKIEDLKKARFYLQYEIDLLEEFFASKSDSDNMS